MNQAADELAKGVLTEYAERTGEDLKTLKERLDPIINNRPLIDKLAAILNGEDQCVRAQQQLDALAEFNSEQKQAGRQAWLDLKAPKFGQLNWKAALAGAEVVHYFDVGVGKYGISLPTGARLSAVRSTAAEMEARAPSNSELTALAWLVSVQLEGKDVSVLKDLEVPALLGHIRKLPGLTIDKIAEECADLEQWLNLTMESELKNS